MTLWITTLALLLAGSVHAQPVWRCGPDGSVYSNSACAEGRPVVVADARSAAEVQAARTVASSERTLAERQAQERARRETTNGNRLVGIHSPNAVVAVNAPEVPRRKVPAKPLVVRLAKPAS